MLNRFKGMMSRGEKVEKEEIIALAAEIALRFENAKRLKNEAEGNEEEGSKMEEVLIKLLGQEFGEGMLAQIKKLGDYENDKDFRQGIVAEYIAEHPEVLVKE